MEIGRENGDTYLSPLPLGQPCLPETMAAAGRRWGTGSPRGVTRSVPGQVVSLASGLAPLYLKGAHTVLAGLGMVNQQAITPG